jgi:hypothetical protein
MDVFSHLLANRRIPGEHIRRNESGSHDEGLGGIDDTSIEEVISTIVVDLPILLATYL